MSWTRQCVSTSQGTLRHSERQRTMPKSEARCLSHVRHVYMNNKGYLTIQRSRRCYQQLIWVFLYFYRGKLETGLLHKSSQQDAMSPDALLLPFHQEAKNAYMGPDHQTWLIQDGTHLGTPQCNGRPHVHSISTTVPSTTCLPGCAKQKNCRLIVGDGAAQSSSCASSFSASNSNGVDAWRNPAGAHSRETGAGHYHHVYEDDTAAVSSNDHKHNCSFAHESWASACSMNTCLCMTAFRREYSQCFVKMNWTVLSNMEATLKQRPSRSMYNSSDLRYEQMQEQTLYEMLSDKCTRHTYGMNYKAMTHCRVTLRNPCSSKEVPWMKHLTPGAHIYGG